MPPPPPSGTPGFGAPAPAATAYAPSGGPALGPHTKVMGRRIVAYLIDGLIGGIIAGVLFFAVADSATLPPGFGDVCGLIEGFNLCVQAGDRVWLAEGGNAALVVLVGIAYFVLAHIVIQGKVGGSPGKLVMGLRVVSAETSGLAGIGRCAIRSVLLIVDGFFFIGFIVALVTPNRQRIGDLAAKTLVVPKGVVGGATPAAAYAGAPQPTAYAQPTAFQQPAQQPFAQPAPQPAEAAPAAQPAQTTSASPGEPQWDAARNAWIMWDTSRSAWMIHDAASGQWRPM